MRDHYAKNKYFIVFEIFLNYFFLIYLLYLYNYLFIQRKLMGQLRFDTTHDRHRQLKEKYLKPQLKQNGKGG